MQCGEDTTREKLRDCHLYCFLRMKGVLTIKLRIESPLTLLGLSRIPKLQ